MATDFELPELGEGVESAVVSRIYVAEGDSLEADQNIMELETEKAVADLPCPLAGKISDLAVSEGDSVSVGERILTVEENADENQDDAQENESKTEKQDSHKPAGDPGEFIEPEAETPDAETEQEEDEQEQEQHAKKQGAEKEHAEKESAQPKKETPEQSTAESEQPNASSTSTSTDGSSANGSSSRTRAAKDADRRGKMPPPAGPATRRLARKLDIDLDDFQPPEGGRIRQEDVVQAFLESGKADALYSKPLPDFTKFGDVQRESLNSVAQTSARRLAATWKMVPHVTQHGRADITDLEAARVKHAEHSSGNAKITLTSIAVKSVVGLLREFPKFNSSFDSRAGEVILKKYFHVGVAMDTEHGLLVPVLRDVDRKSIEQIAVELQKLTEKAGRRQLQQQDLAGGTFTISNQGSIGGGEFTPIVNYPEVAILGMARARTELKMIAGQPSERLVLPLSLSYDHRVINGADAARFMERLCAVLSDEFTLLVAT